MPLSNTWYVYIFKNFPEPENVLLWKGIKRINKQNEMGEAREPFLDHISIDVHNLIRN